MRGARRTSCRPRSGDQPGAWRGAPRTSAKACGERTPRRLPGCDIGTETTCPAAHAVSRPQAALALSFDFVSARDLQTASRPRLKPRLRGVLHQYAFALAVIAGAILVAAETARARISVAVYAVSLAAMFGSSALYHRITWRPERQRHLRLLDHAAIY